MNKIPIPPFYYSMLSFVVIFLAAFQSFGQITITAPVSGQSVVKGVNLVVRFSSPTTLSYGVMEVYKGSVVVPGAFKTSVVPGVDYIFETGTYQLGNDYRIKVYDATTQPNVAWTNYFSIVATAPPEDLGKITITTPVAGQSIIKGNNLVVTFSSPTPLSYGVMEVYKGSAKVTGAFKTSVVPGVDYNFETSTYLLGNDYRIKVYDATTQPNEAWTNYFSIVSIPPPVAVSATSISTQAFVANWNAVQGASSYRLDVSRASDFSSFVDQYNNYTVSNTYAPIYSTISSATTYYYRVRAVNSYGASINSNVITFTTLPYAPTANAGSNITLSSFAASWTAQGVATYRLDVSTNSNFSTFVAGYNNVTINGTTHTVQGLTTNTVYFYRVRAVTSSGTSPNSNVVQVLITPPVTANFAEQKTFGEDGSTISHTINYLNGFEKPLQSQIKDFSNGKIWASQPLFNGSNEAAAYTLSAPISETYFTYKNNFVSTTSGNPYSAVDFDKPLTATNGQGEVNNPVPVGEAQGTLGWYYSNSNTLEPTTPTTDFPYSRSYVPPGPNPKTSTSASPGDAYRMGSGHETKSEKHPISVGELDHYFKLRSHLIETPNPYSPNLLASFPTTSTSKFKANQDVTLSSSGGYLIVTCNQSTSTPGVVTLPTIGVAAGKSYTLKIKGYKNGSNAVRLYVRTAAGADIVWPGPALPNGAHNEQWISSTFTVPAGITSIYVGVLWEQPLIGMTFAISALDLRLQAPSTSIGYKLVSVDADGKKAATFIDADGRTLASALITSTAGTAATPVYTYDYWSYNYHNDVGQLIATVAPNGVNTSSNAPPKFVTRFRYDYLGRLIETTSPDEGTSQFVYTLDGKIRFSQNDVQRNANPKRFSYTNYDYLGRLIESGEYSNLGTGFYVFEPHSTLTPAATSVLNAGILEAKGFTGITRKADPNNRCTNHTYIDYDKQDAGYVTDANHQAQAVTFGDVSKTENSHGKTWYSYDEFGQLKWTKQLVSGLPFYKTVDYTYDYLGNVTDVAYQKSQSDAFYHHYVYDNDQRLVEVKTSRDGVEANKVSRAKYYYYLHGPLKRTELLAGAQKIQGIDYTYTIAGGLKAINHGDPANDPGKDGISGPNLGFMKDAFGETLHYHDNDYAPASSASFLAPTVNLDATYPNQWGGNLRAATYNNATDLAMTASGNQQRIFGYQYDARNQLSTAKWGTVGTIIAFGDAQKESISGYDKNGNIQALTRTGNSAQVTANYGYVYEANTNKLDKVNHAGTQLVDYTYNAIGQMIQQTEDGKTMKVEYSAYGLTSMVRDATDQALVSYAYDDQGNVSRKVYYENNVAKKTVYYVHEAGGNVLAMYEQAMPTGPVQLIEVPIYGAGRIGVFKPVVSTYFYEVSDHLGNVRAVIGAPKVETYTATMETEKASTEEPPFKNIADTRVTYSTANQTPNSTGVTGNEVMRLNNTKPAGPTISLAVSPGDVIDVSAWAYYEAGTNNFSSTLTDAVMLQAIAAAFGGVPGGPEESGRIYNRVQTGFSGSLGSQNTTALPAAFITCVIYDKNDVKQFFASKGVTSAGNMAKEQLVMAPIKIEQPGFIYISLYNRSNTTVPVYFDELVVKHNQSSIVNGADYYPFGLALDSKDIKDEPYRFGYQGQFAEKNDITGWNEFELRMYDARIGRWTSPDPYGQFASPYLGMGNAPHMSIDPDGGWVPDIPDIVITATRLPSYGAIVGGLATGILSSTAGPSSDYIRQKDGKTAKLGRTTTDDFDRVYELDGSVNEFSKTGQHIRTWAPGSFDEFGGIQILGLRPDPNALARIGANLITHMLLSFAAPELFAARGAGTALGNSARYVNLASKSRTAHIIAGDLTGGGHAWFGSMRSFMNGVTGAKSMFPVTWSNSKIMHAVSEVATSNPWVQQTGKAGAMLTKSGKAVKFATEGFYEGVKIKVIHTREAIITAFKIHG